MSNGNLKYFDPNLLPTLSESQLNNELIILYNRKLAKIPKSLFLKILDDYQKLSEKSSNVAEINTTNYPSTKWVFDYIESKKNIPNGIAGLNSNGKIDVNQIPSIAILDLIPVAEKTFEEFLQNADSYTFEKGDIIQITQNDGKPLYYSFIGVDKKSADSYIQLTLSTITIDMVQGLRTELDNLDYKIEHWDLDKVLRAGAISASNALMQIIDSLGEKTNIAGGDITCQNYNITTKSEIKSYLVKVYKPSHAIRNKESISLESDLSLTFNKIKNYLKVKCNLTDADKTTNVYLRDSNKDEEIAYLSDITDSINYPMENLNYDDKTVTTLKIECTNNIVNIYINYFSVYQPQKNYGQLPVKFRKKNFTYTGMVYSDGQQKFGKFVLNPDGKYSFLFGSGYIDDVLNVGVITYSLTKEDLEYQETLLD